MASDYIDNKEFESLIRLYIKSLEAQQEEEKEKRKNSEDGENTEPIKINLQPDPILAECIANYFYLLSGNIIKAFRFSMVDEEDAKQEAVMVCLKKIGRFDTERGKAFNYFTTMILNHYRQLYRSARNYGELKKRFMERQILSVPQHLRKGIVWYDSDAGENE